MKASGVQQLYPYTKEYIYNLHYFGLQARCISQLRFCGTVSSGCWYFVAGFSGQPIGSKIFDLRCLKPQKSLSIFAVYCSLALSVENSF
jgi:hypothetical protein